MFNRQSLHMALLLWGCIFSLIAALCISMNKNFDKGKRLWLLCQQLTCSVLLLSDAFAWGYRGYPGALGSFVVHSSNFLVFAFSDIVLLLFHGYLCCYLFPDSPVRLRLAGGKKEGLEKDQQGNSDCNAVLYCAAIGGRCDSAFLLWNLTGQSCNQYLHDIDVYRDNDGAGTAGSTE